MRLAPDCTRAWHLRTMNNTVFLVTKDGEPAPVAALRVHRAGWRSSTAIRRELELLDYLAERLPSQDLPVMMAARHISHCLWALGHAADQGAQWVNTHLQARMDTARRCLMTRIG